MRLGALPRAPGRRRVSRDAIRLVALLSACTALSGIAVASVQAAAGSVQARLAGLFTMHGVVTFAQSIPGEHTGEHISRRWVFAPACTTGACSRIKLTRGRGIGLPTVSVELVRRSRGYYVGSGIFYAPLICGGRTYRPGERVHYTVSVRVTAAELIDGQLVADAIRASYSSRLRDNLTPCVGLFGQADAARYTGVLAP